LKITILAVGRLGRSSEQALAEVYVQRASQCGRALGLGPVEIVEVDVRPSSKEADADALLGALPDGAFVMALDEHGPGETSRDFAARLAALRDAGERRLAMVIGGADGLSPRVLGAARAQLAFGRQTWPHALARVMACEQIYRATTILAGAPYHRD
jgi:23S rRNA (pseudouridine1915-N3)-methyltransferase